MKTRLAITFALASACIAVFGTGCRKVYVRSSEPICNDAAAGVTVHLVGVNRFEKDTWDNMSMTDYWKPDNQQRIGAKAYTEEIKFKAGECQKIIKPGDKIRKVWKKNGAEYMFVLAYFPNRQFDDAPGNADPRRLQIPAPDSKGWGMSQNKIEIFIEDGKVRCATIPK